MNNKLLQLNVAANWGSTGKIAEAIGNSAIIRGYDSYIAYGRYMNPSSSALVKIGSKADNVLHYLNNRFFDGEGLASKSPTRDLIDRIKEISPDIIHLHNIHDHWLNYKLLFEYLATVDIPIVWTFHDCWSFTGHCYHFENSGCNKWLTQCHDCKFNSCLVDNSKRNFLLKKELFTRICDRLTVVCVSEWIEKQVRRSFLKNADVKVIHNGTDIDVFNINKDVPKGKEILAVSNVWPAYKGLNDIIELRKSLPTDTKITIVGLSEKQVKNLPDGITGITRTSNIEQLVNLYNRASVLVNASRNDTFPTVNLEALACGTPVVTYRTGGSPEAVDKNTGLVVNKGDLSGLRDAVKFIIDNPNRFSPEACRERAFTHFNKDTQFNKYVELYDSLLR